ncbi:hypothetical protein CSE16_15290 [Solibacillus sp. R5-41]|nr:hypothetical protein CSE16_15290 [Solibacillus sp. R5-41]
MFQLYKLNKSFLPFDVRFLLWILIKCALVWLAKHMSHKALCKAILYKVLPLNLSAFIAPLPWEVGADGICCKRDSIVRTDFSAELVFQYSN